MALLDGSLTLSIPPRMTAYTGLDALAHAIEAYTSKFKKNALSDMLTREALRLLGGALERAVRVGSDADARSEMLLGACFAGMAFANSPVGAVHALAYPIGALFHVPHGLSISLLLPHVVRFNAAEAQVAEMYSELAGVAFPALSALPSGRPRALAFAEKLAALAVDFEIPTRLRDVGISEGDIGRLVEDAMKQTRLLPNNPRPVGPSEAKELFEIAL
uniref:Fe-containing alcohol dehydrogenase-like C-terminal domain-containing protein n=1 Tax=Arcella intermedia TaxID=1963864 RepID=A0A6B2LH08_9EUKA